jgi:hypothetical protein
VLRNRELRGGIVFWSAFVLRSFSEGGWSCLLLVACCWSSEHFSAVLKLSHPFQGGVAVTEIINCSRNSFHRRGGWGKSVRARASARKKKEYNRNSLSIHFEAKHDVDGSPPTEGFGVGFGRRLRAPSLGLRAKRSCKSCRSCRLCRSKLSFKLIFSEVMSGRIPSWEGPGVGFAMQLTTCILRYYNIIAIFFCFLQIPWDHFAGARDDQSPDHASKDIEW